MSGPSGSAFVRSRLTAVEPVTATVVCLRCKNGLASPKSISEHLANIHGLASEEVAAELASALCEQKDAAAVDHPLREKYRAAPVSADVATPLQPLAHLQVSLGKRCPWCVKYFKVERHIRAHGDSAHGRRGEELLTLMKRAAPVSIQTLFLGNKTKFFPVSGVQIGGAEAPFGRAGTAAGSSATKDAAAASKATQRTATVSDDITPASRGGAPVRQRTKGTATTGAGVAAAPSAPATTGGAAPKAPCAGWPRGGVKAGVQRVGAGVDGASVHAVYDAAVAPLVVPALGAKSVATAKGSNEVGAAGDCEDVVPITDLGRGTQACEDEIEAMDAAKLSLSSDKSALSAAACSTGGGVGRGVGPGSGARKPTKAAPPHVLHPTVHDFIKGLLINPGQNAITDVGEGRRLASDFLANIGLDTVLEDAGLSMVDAARLCGDIDRTNGVECALYEDSKRYFRMFSRVRRFLSPSLVRRLTVKSNDNLASITVKTEERYSDDVGRYLVFTLRLVEEAQCNVEGVEELFDSYKKTLGRKSGNWDQRMLGVHDILCMILLQRLEMCAPTKKLLVRLFAACAGVSCKFSKEGDVLEPPRFKESWEISAPLASLQFSTTMVALVSAGLLNTEIRGEILPDLSGTSTAAATEAEAEPDAKKSADVIEDRIVQLCDMVDVQQNTSASIIRTYLAHCMAVYEAHHKDGDFLECTRHEKCGFINGVELSMKQLGVIVRKEQDAVEHMLNNTLLLGFPLPSNMSDIFLQLTDHRSNRAVGFSFMSFPPNRTVLGGLVSQFMSHLCTSPQAKVDLHMLGPSGSTEDLFTFSGIPFSITRTSKWLTHSRICQERIASLLHICSGSPARCTETASLSLLNLPTSMRNVYIAEGSILLIYRYSKMRSLRGTDNHIARFADQRTSELLLVYLIFVRTAELALTQAMNSTQRPSWVHMSALFCHGGERVSSKRLQLSCERMFERHNVAFNVSMLRQWTSAMVRVLTDERNNHHNAIVDELEAIGHLQHGHSVNVADRMYGRSGNDIADLGHTQLRKYRLWCREWQRHLNLDSGLREGVGDGPSKTGKGPSGSNEAAESDGKESSVLLERVVRETEARVLKRLLSSTDMDRTAGQNDSESASKARRVMCRAEPSLDGRRTPKDRSDDTSIGNAAAVNAGTPLTSLRPTCAIRLLSGSPLPRSHPNISGPMKGVRRGGDSCNPFEEGSVSGVATGTIEESQTSFPRLMQPMARPFDEDSTILIPGLRDMLGNERAVFRSQMQADVVATMRYGHTSALVVMPTAAGKSIIFLLACFLDNPGTSSILIVPLRALKDEMLQRCQDLNISAEMWSPEVGARPLPADLKKVYLMSAEHLDRQAFHEFVRKLSAVSALARIIVDEAHLTVNWALFRPCMERFQYTLQAIPREIPTFLFSATIPPREAGQVALAHNVREALVYRMPSYRDNVGISIQYCKSVKPQALRLEMQASVCSAVDKIVSATLFPGVEDRGCRVLVYGLRIDDLNRLKGVLSTHLQKASRPNISETQVLHYNGALPVSERKRIHGCWQAPIAGIIRVMLCTNAFGTGIDTDRVGGVVHLGGSNSLSDYAQEIGRCGRNGEPAKAILVYSTIFATRHMRVVSGYSAHARSECTGAAVDMQSVGEVSRIHPPDVAMASVRGSSLFAEFRNWAEAKDVCLKNSLYAVLDGVSPGLCVNKPRSVNCEHCDKLCMTTFSLRTVGGSHPSFSTPVKTRTIAPRVSGLYSPAASAGKISPKVLVFGGNPKPREGQTVGRSCSDPPQGRDEIQPRSTGIVNSPAGVSVAIAGSKTATPCRRDQTVRAEDAPAPLGISNESGEDGDGVAEFQEVMFILSPRHHVIVTALKDIMDELQGCCPHCLVRKSLRTSHERCPIGMFCGSCSSSQHRRASCNVRVQIPNKCYRCGLGYIGGSNLHTTVTFGKTACPYQLIKHVCLNMFFTGYGGDAILLTLMNEEQRQNLLVDKPLRDGSAVATDFMRWLFQETKGVPHIVVVFLHWARTSGIVTEKPELWITV